MRISDWSSDVCSSDLKLARGDAVQAAEADIIARQGKAANDEQFARDAKAQRGADRRVVFQHLAQRLRLLVKEQRLIVGLDAERREIGRASCRERVCQYV